MQVVGNAASVTQLMSNATSSFSAIQKALTDMRDLPTELKGLQHTAEEGDRKVVSLSKILRPEDEDRVRPSLERLSEALKVARELDLHLAGRQSFGKDFIEGLLGAGASRQVPEAKRLKESIQFDLDIMNGVLLELLHQKVQNVNSVLESGTFRSRSQAPESEVAMKLERLSKLEIGEKIIQVVAVAASHSSDYRPLTGVETSDVGGDIGNDDDIERGSVVGGYEVDNNSKIRLTMEAEDPRYFYVVTLDSSNLEPQLYRPEIALAKNQLQINRSAASGYRRIFPDPHCYPGDDPLSWKLAKDTTLPRDGVERCFVYVVSSRSRLEPDGQVPTIMHVKLKLDTEGTWADEEEIIVERLQFDVK